MRNLLLGVLILLSLSSFQPKKDTKAAYQLIERVIPGYSNQFQVEIIEKGETDYFEIDAAKQKVILKGNNSLSIASALNWYLKYTCNAHKSWCGDQLNLPKTLPLPNEKTTKTIPQKYRVNFNYCTFNYSASWWNWERWQQEIDFMAMNGINMPLSVVGIEAVWYNTLLKFNFTDLEARTFLVDPAHSGWQWMTNIQGNTNPLPKSWIDMRIILGQKIMERQLELGMMPIQQGFTGYVPKEMMTKFTNASIEEEKRWCNFEGTAQLDPLDPLFKKLGSTFLKEQEKLFGSNHYYAADPFHEGHPPKEGSQYLKSVGEAIKSLLVENDPNYKWIMQSWSIKKDIVSVIPKEKLLVLDLNGNTAKRHDYFWGYDYVVGNLHNFGGRINMHGDLKLLASNKHKNQSQTSPNAVGTGCFMESIGQNPAYYDLAYEMGISADSVHINQWLNNYATRRYGKASENAKNAWKILLNTAYREGTDGVEKSSIICARPALNVKKSGPNHGFEIPYNNKDLFEALNLLMQDQVSLKASEAYRYDIVDLLRQVLTNYGQPLNKKAAKAYKEGNKEDFKKYSTEFLTLLKDVDNLLSSRQEFSLQKWISDARSHGVTKEEKDYYEYYASMLVTVWGPLTENEEPIIFDYSWREWSGLIEKYYLKRWDMFYGMLEDSLESGTPYVEENLPLVHGRETFRANDFYNKLADWEINWIKSNKTFTNTKNIDEVEIVNELVKKYKNKIE